MIVFRETTRVPKGFRRGAASIGNFDGVHRGHACIVAELRAAADRLGGPAVAFTFDPPPAALLRPGASPPALSTVDDKLAALEGLGVDAVWVYPTDELILNLSPPAFFDRFLCSELEARGVVEGADFRFGKGRSGAIDLLARLAEQAGMAFQAVSPLVVDGAPASSSRIRAAVAEGRVAEAAELLGRPYSVTGLVVHGAGRGATIGFPTANVDQVPTLLPGVGVYAAAARQPDLDEPWRPAAVNIGPNPTFGEQRLKLEVHVVDLSRDLYDRRLEVRFLAKLRDVHPFPNLSALQTQLHSDVSAAVSTAHRLGYF